ncbi:flagellar motor protein MotA [Helicobacter monodelphidis]|uniref:MotA/TolQ/ExbB proton channel family protein n=1 Tax=Helicobacter sp. 15-1451 TaxID=2004995 RepID=UPI000DCC68B7|nr:MotA/TolQ/ExbB proton channel family protein [Helicobacter sp. 15-1451]RAX56926.1 flagellar motor protein MotA [Helicobacter sp. 15-1451]
MTFTEQLSQYFSSSGIVTYIVLIWLSLYFILSLWIFLYRILILSGLLAQEKLSLESLMQGNYKLSRSSLLSYSLKRKHANVTRELLEVSKQRAIARATVGLTLLSVFASTAPFIGLFGTVVEILEAFSRLGEGARATLEVIAPVISKALIATAAGILTAIPAYSFHILLKRKSFELVSIIQMEIEMIINMEQTSGMEIKQG